VRFLLDEQLHTRTSAAMTALASADKDEYAYLLDVGDFAGAGDDMVPGICREQAFDVLVTANHKDFAARKVLYQSRLDAGIHVVALRPRSPSVDR
jgi:hypothetical protein